VHSVIQGAVAAEHVKDMLGHAAQDSRAREARRNRPGRRWWRHAGMAASSGADRRGPAATQCCPD
jgi:hypothetical protein